MIKILLVLLALTHANVFASIITHSDNELSNSNYILSMSNQQYTEQYQKVMLLTQMGELDKAKQALVDLLTVNPYDIIALDISGNLLLAENKLPQAIDAFNRVLSSKRSPEVMAKLGVCYLLLENNEKAKIWLTQSLSLSPDNELALRYLAWIEEKSFNKNAQFHYLSQLVKLGINKKALYEYHLQYLSLLIENNNLLAGLNFIESNREKIATSADSIVNSIKFLEIELLLKANKVESAKDKFRQYPVPDSKSDVAVNYSILSVFYYASIKDYKKAESLINELPAENSQAKSLAQYSLAKVYFDHGDFEAAHNKLMLLLNNENSTSLQMNYIDDIVANYSVQSRYSDAIKFLKAQIEKDKDIPQYQHQLAELYIISGRSQAAITQLDEVISSFPNYAPSYIVKARQLVKKNDQKEVVDFFNLALDKLPNVTDLWLDYAKFYFDNNKADQSITILEKAIKANEGNPLITYELATAYDSQNLLDKSESLYLKVLQNYPEYIPALDNLASNYFALNKELDKATVLAKRAFLLAPNDVFIMNLRAQAYVYEKEYQKAIDLLTPVIDNFTDSGLGYLSLSKAYTALKQDTLAKEYLIKALEHTLPIPFKKQALAIQDSL